MLASYQGKKAAIGKLKDIMNDIQTSKFTFSFNEIRYISQCITYCFSLAQRYFGKCCVLSLLLDHPGLKKYSLCSHFLKLLIHDWCFISITISFCKKLDPILYIPRSWFYICFKILQMSMIIYQQAVVALKNNLFFETNLK